jgi:type IV pilus assembly protein PilB
VQQRLQGPRRHLPGDAHFSEDIQRIILRGGSALDIAEQARKEGIRSLRESGLLKVKLGMTSLEEVLSVTNE